MYSLRPVVVDLTEADFSIYHHVEIVTFFTLKGDYWYPNCCKEICNRDACVIIGLEWFRNFCQTGEVM